MDTHTVSSFSCEECKRFFSECNKCRDSNGQPTSHDDEELGVPRCHAHKVLKKCKFCKNNINNK